MSDWCTIESDPGVFTELIKNIGVKGVQVEEISDFNHLIENDGYNPNILNDYDEDLYFPKQVINNACATQAIIGILLNNEEKLEIGPDLTEFKSFTKLMDPYMKGLSISNCEKIRIEHNKFSKPEPFIYTSQNKGQEEDVFHYVSYINFKNNVYEIDGLREGPILIYENVQDSEWIEKVKPAILDRINLYANNEIKFNLLAVIPDKKLKYLKKKEELVKKKLFLSELLGKDEKKEDDVLQIFSGYENFTNEELNGKLFDIENSIAHLDLYIYEEEEKYKRYKIENERRQHNYIPLIFEMLKNMAERNILEVIYNECKNEENKK